MYYNTFKGKKISALGLGCMRLPICDNEHGKIDVVQTEKMVDYAIAHGVNYFDTAFRYHEGTSETIIGNILKKYPRESYYLADKLPGFSISNFENCESIFEEQLEKCGVEYFDFYLLHNVFDQNVDRFLDPQYGVVEYLMSQKKKGRIHHLGFSTHASLGALKKFLSVYGECMEFAQLQINWLDWEFQHAKEKIELMQEHGIAVWVMEPVRGGNLARLDVAFEERLKAMHSEWTMPEWALRFVQSIDGIVVTLSGMSNMQQLQENIKTYNNRRILTEKEKKELMEIGRVITGDRTVPCTGCRYCVEHCPQGLDIPHLLRVRNEFSVSNGGFIVASTVVSVTDLPLNKQPSACIGCQNCEAVCPQGIHISEAMTELTEHLEKRK